VQRASPECPCSNDGSVAFRQHQAAVAECSRSYFVNRERSMRPFAAFSSMRYPLQVDAVTTPPSGEKATYASAWLPGGSSARHSTAPLSATQTRLLHRPTPGGASSSTITGPFGPRSSACRTSIASGRYELALCSPCAICRRRSSTLILRRDVTSGLPPDRTMTSVSSRGAAPVAILPAARTLIPLDRLASARQPGG
jgi:hypothetical protein